MKKIYIPILLAALIFTACGAAAPVQSSLSQAQSAAATAEYHALTAQQAKERMDSGAEIIIVDVRTQAEYDEGHISGAIVLPNEEITTEMPAALPSKEAEILLYCRSGNRSKQAADKLVAMGYTAVYDFGGIKDWPYEVVQ